MRWNKYPGSLWWFFGGMHDVVIRIDYIDCSLICLPFLCEVFKQIPEHPSSKPWQATKSVGSYSSFKLTETSANLHTNTAVWQQLLQQRSYWTPPGHLVDHYKTPCKSVTKLCQAKHLTSLNVSPLWSVNISRWPYHSIQTSHSWFSLHPT